LHRTIRRLAAAFLLCVMVGIFPLVALWKNNLGQVPASAVYLPLLYTFLLVLVLYAGWLSLTRSPEKAALLCCASVIFLLMYGHLYNLVGSKVLLDFSIGYAKLFAAWFIIFAAVCILIIRARRLPNLWLLILPAGLLVLFNAVPIASSLIKAKQSTAQPLVAAAKSGQKDLPDIYYIVLDAYAREDIIKEVTGYDNSPFTGALKERGFYIPECAFSNYAVTELTLQSVLNYDTLDHLNGQKTDLILDNKAGKTFRSYGYQFVTGRGWAPFNDIQTSDVYLNYAIDQGVQDDLAQLRFASLYLNTTVFRLLTELYKNNPEKFSIIPFWEMVNKVGDTTLKGSTFWYLQNDYMFDSLQKIPEKPGSFFVYAHINAPHGPYIYNADGSFRDPFEVQDEEVLYRNAIIYLNKRILEVIDTLQKKSDPPPIIIIQGDHGMHKMTQGLDKHKILSAYYLPGTLNTPLYPTITPVNNFRLILRNYFDPTVELLPDVIFEKLVNEVEAIPASCDIEP